MKSDMIQNVHGNVGAKKKMIEPIDLSANVGLTKRRKSK